MEIATNAAHEAAPASKPYFFVLQSGLITSALALAGVYWLNKNAHDFNIMGWYLDYTLPIGAGIVGFAAGSGYGLASWYSGIRISRWLLVIVLFLQAVCYVAAEYVEYRDVYARMESRHLVMKETGHRPSFFEYYDYKARNFRWKAENSKEAFDPLGGAGYFFLLMGAAGFIAGGLMAPAILLRVAYCDDCQRYMAKKVLAVIPAGTANRQIAEIANKEEFLRLQQTAVTTGEQILQRLNASAASQDLQTFKQELNSYGTKKENRKIARRVEINLVWCKLCEQGHILPVLQSGYGKQIRKTKLRTIHLAKQFIRGIKE